MYVNRITTIHYSFAMMKVLLSILFVFFASLQNEALGQSPGSLDLSFDPGTGANGLVLAAAIQTDGKILIGGGFTSYNGTSRNGIARLTADGSLDSSFDPGAGANPVHSISIQSDGKIIIGGTFHSYNGTPCHFIARLNEDGSLDPTFDTSQGVDWVGSIGVLATAIQSDGKILIGGFFFSFNGSPINGIARLNLDGSLDPSFDSGTGVGNDGAEENVETVAIQSDGKIIIGGKFYFYDGTPRYCLARLNEDGSLDASFDPGESSYSVLSTVLQNDGKILIGDRSIKRIRRLHQDGSLDTTFDPGSGASGPSIRAIAIQGDGKILAGGEFWSFNGTPRNNIARLNEDGSLDLGFDPGTGVNSSVYVSAIQSDGRVVIGGWFSSYNGTPRNRIARLYCDLAVHINDAVSKEFSIYPNPAATSVSVVIREQSGRAELVLRNALGQEIMHSTVVVGRNEVPLSGLASGLYAVEVNTSTWRRTQWLIVE